MRHISRLAVITCAVIGAGLLPSPQAEAESAKPPTAAPPQAPVAKAVSPPKAGSQTTPAAKGWTATSETGSVTPAAQPAPSAPAAKVQAAPAAKVQAAPAAALLVPAAATAAPAAARAAAAQSAPTATAPAAAPAAAPGVAQAAAIDDWVLACAGSTDGKQHCSLKQRLADPNGRQIVSFTAGRTAAQAYIEVSVPLGLSIPYGVALVLPDTTEFKMQLADCLTTGCRAIVGLDEAILAKLKGAERLGVRFQDSKSGKVLTINGSLRGFSAGIAKVLASG